MARIVPGLLARYQSRMMNPAIVEFDTLAHAADLLPTLAGMIQTSFLSSFSGPIDLVSLVSQRTRSLRDWQLQMPSFNISLPSGKFTQGLGMNAANRDAHFFDRVASRFQNSILSLKFLSLRNMVALPLAPEDIDEVAGWSEVSTVYEDKMQYALSYPSHILPYQYVFSSPRTGKPYTTTYYTKKLMGADVANQEGFSGQGITVACPDTGGAPSHPQTFGMKYHSCMREKGQFVDRNGHGVWCTSCVGGKSVMEPTFNVKVEGVAPECTLIGVKCLGFLIGMGFQSDIIEAMEYAALQGADIVSMSLGADEMPDSPDDDPEIKVLDELVAKGIIPVIAAGNSGPKSGSIGTPGCAPNALTVGAWDPINGGVAPFSSRGPTKWGEIKPDVCAPGVDIYSGTVGLLDTVGDKVPNRYAILSGTSMATPGVAGLLALVKQYYKSLGQSLTVELVKTVCQAFSEHPKDNDTGWGFIEWRWFKQYAQSMGWT